MDLSKFQGIAMGNGMINLRPKVSVIIATYNRSHFVCEAIESVLNQTFQDFEIIVIDDGSIDNTKQVLEKYGSHIQYIFQENKGRAEARNTGIKNAKCEYIAFLDDDDIWLPNKLEKQVIFLDSHPDIELVYTFTEVVDEGGRLLEEETKNHLKLYKKAMKIGYTYEGMSRLCVMFLSTVVVRKKCFDKVGIFDSSIPAFEDWDLYLRIALYYRIGTIPEPLVKYRFHKGQSTMSEFISGRIQTSQKHLSLIDSDRRLSWRGKVSYNFYIHLATMYYIASDFVECRKYALRALKLRPFALFCSRLGVYLLLTLLPFNFVRWIRQIKRNSRLNKLQMYPERIIPEETFGGPLATHLKRYDFAKQFCTNKIVLDAACGVGYGSSYLSEVAKEVIGIDNSGEAITYAKEHYQRENTRFKVMNVHNLEFPDKHFDIVCSFETLEHLDKPERFISEVKRALKDDGIFIVSTPHVKKTNYNPKNPYHKVEFSQRDFVRLLNNYFMSVEIFGQRRLQSIFHYYLQKIDIFHLRALLPNSLRRKICHSVATRSWNEADLGDFVISREGIGRATELIGVCYLSTKG